MSGKQPCELEHFVYRDCEAAIEAHSGAFLRTWSRLQLALADVAVLREEVAMLKRRLRRRRSGKRA